MRVAYFDAFSGLSGDMTIGAFLDLGMPLAALEEGLAPLGLEEVTLDVGHRIRSGIRATKFTVDAPEISGHHHHGSGHDGHSHGHRSYRDIRSMLDRAALSPRVRQRAQLVFRALAVAEARIHAMPIDDVGFHEVGAVDAIVDIVGAAICLEHFGVEQVFVSPLPLGSGRTRSQHGVIPVPAPATVEILRGFPTRFEDGSHELVTPTGAAIVGALATPGAPPLLAPVSSGFGAGERDLPDRPNLLRVVLADLVRPAKTPPPAHEGLEHDERIVLEANVDDMNPELFEPAMEALFEAGALDVSLSPLTMKRGRPATLVRVIADPARAEALSLVLLRDTSTIGVRSYAVARRMLPRRSREVHTPYGAISVKIVSVPGAEERAAPEYTDCQRAAREHGVPVSQVYEAARLAVRR